MTRELKDRNDPRTFGRGDVFDNFYERSMRGEKMRAGWANPTDFEKEPLD